MKKLAICAGTLFLSLNVFAQAPQTYKGEIIDSQCAALGGHQVMAKQGESEKEERSRTYWFKFHWFFPFWRRTGVGFHKPRRTTFLAIRGMAGIGVARRNECLLAYPVCPGPSLISLIAATVLGEVRRFF